MRTIFHIDMDAFFVSVEELYDPSLKGKPVVVGGKGHERGVVSAASYAARKFGVHSAMPLRTAAALCPQAIFVDGTRERYQLYSRKVKAVLETFTPKVEMASIDEAYLDMTGTERLHGPPMQAAHKLHEAIKAATNLNNSIGVSTARLVSKVASDQAKPNGVLWIPPGAEAAFLAPLSIRKVPGIGKVAEKNLQDLGIYKVGDLTRLDDRFLRERFGKFGLALAGKAHGLDAGSWFEKELGQEEDPKSVSHEHTFLNDTADQELLESTLAHMSEKVGRRLREYGLYARTVQIKFRYSDFSTFTRAHSLNEPTQLDTEIFQAARGLFQRHWTKGREIRLIGVQTSGFELTEGQLNLLDGERNEKLKKVLSAADTLRDKFGDGSVNLAGSLRGRFRERVHEAMPKRTDGKS
ncbi:MAG TPA: DNA polymerase IV [Bryobacteraceae bacterium]|nr:DNA polymerase IV [Bryobacteraceae bacterium]